MLALIGLFGLLCFVGVSFGIGVRLTWIGLRRGGSLPETTIGLSMLLAGGIGTGLGLVPMLRPETSPETVYWLIQVSSTSSSAGFLMLFLFIWRVFRPSERWAAVFFTACSLGLIGAWAAEAIALERGQSLGGVINGSGFWFWEGLGARMAAYCWAATESFRYYGVMRRRLRMGLAEPLLADRFRMWGIATSAVIGIWLTTGVSRLIFDDIEAGRRASFLFISTFGMVCSGGLWLAFFPPGWYRARIERAGAALASADAT